MDGEDVGMGYVGDGVAKMLLAGGSCGLRMRWICGSGRRVVLGFLRLGSGMFVPSPLCGVGLLGENMEKGGM